MYNMGYLIYISTLNSKWVIPCTVQIYTNTFHTSEPDAVTPPAPQESRGPGLAFVFKWALRRHRLPARRRRRRPPLPAAARHRCPPPPA